MKTYIITSDDEIFYDAVGDENQMKVIQEQIREASAIENKSNSTGSKRGSSAEEIHERAFQDIQNKVLGRLEDNSEISKSVESTGITKNIIQNPIQMSTNLSSSKNKFFAMLGKKPIEAEFSRENIKQNNMNHTNFGNLICLQFIDDDNKKQETDFNVASSKKEKTPSSTWIAKFSPNDKYLASGGSDGILRVYRVNIMDYENLNISGDPDFQVIDPNCARYVGHKYDIIDLSWFKVRV